MTDRFKVYSNATVNKTNLKWKINFNLTKYTIVAFPSHQMYTGLTTTRSMRIVTKPHLNEGGIVMCKRTAVWLTSATLLVILSRNHDNILAKQPYLLQ